MSSLELRDARYGELPEIARVMNLAFSNDNLFGELIHPHRKEHPNDADLYWLRRARINFWDYRWKWLVAVDKSPDTGEVVIAGIAQWARLGDGGKLLECAWYDPRNLVKPLSSIAMRLHSLIWVNHACDPKNEDIIERAYPYFDGVWTGDRAESWYLEALAVHPDYQGKGVGRDLVLWGLNQADLEGICASVVSAKDKDEFYQRCGFEVQDGSAGGGEGNPLADVAGGNIWWKMPKSKH
ncbi:hypothetical protein TruAng_003524 [Truncatella angustata]|nr:hypothetical protein TruAng_003524 [Truncatella angustata]